LAREPSWHVLTFKGYMATTYNAIAILGQRAPVVPAGQAKTTCSSLATAVAVRALLGHGERALEPRRVRERVRKGTRRAR
jgi:hypothetical protein